MVLAREASTRVTGTIRPAQLAAPDDAILGPVHVLPVDVFGTGNRTYVGVVDGQAVVVDPPRDLETIRALVDDRGWTVTHVVETHVHNDYVSGGLHLARLCGADYVVPEDAAVRCHARRVADGDELVLGSGRLRALHTPGHTPHHTSYVLSADGHDVAVFTGGGLLFGGVGRTDLLGSGLALDLARSQWDSARRVARDVSADAQVMPTHGFGSFCSIAAASGGGRSLQDLRLANEVFAQDREPFALDLVHRHGPYPTYFSRMAGINGLGTPDEPVEEPRECALGEVSEIAANGSWVLDVRRRLDFDDSHVPGSLSFDLEGAFATYVGWIVPWGDAIHLVGADRDELRRARVELARIGYDRVATSSPFTRTADVELARQQRATGRELLNALRIDPGLHVLDTRLPAEWAAGHVPGALHVPVHELTDRVDEVARWLTEGPGSTPSRVWVYCGSGFRSAIATSMLRRAGIAAVHVDGNVVELLARGAFLA